MPRWNVVLKMIKNCADFSCAEFFAAGYWSTDYRGAVTKTFAAFCQSEPIEHDCEFTELTTGGKRERCLHRTNAAFVGVDVIRHNAYLEVFASSALLVIPSHDAPPSYSAARESM